MRQVVPICCICEKVRDDTGTEPGGGLWQDFEFYMARHMLRPWEVKFSHGYCPGCLLLQRLPDVAEGCRSWTGDGEGHDGFTHV